MKSENPRLPPRWKSHHTVASALLALGLFVAAVVGASSGSTIIRSVSDRIVAQQLVVTADISYMLTSDGAVYSQGLNNFGQLGIGSLQDTPAWSRVNFIDKGAQPTIVKLSTQGEHVLALDSVGGLWVWGSGLDSALGNGSNNPLVKPSKISVSYTFSQIQAGNDFVIALDTRGMLYSWGQNSQGQLGTGTTQALSGPNMLMPGVTFKSITAGSNFALAVESNGALWAWGANDAGQFGNGTKTASTTPQKVSDGPWDTVTASRFSNTVMGIDSRGVLWSWGSNNQALLGTGADWRADQVAENKRVADAIAVIDAENTQTRQTLVTTLSNQRIVALHDEWQTKLKAWNVANPEPIVKEFPIATDPTGTLFKAAHDAWALSYAAWLVANPEPTTVDQLSASDNAAIEAEVVKEFIKIDTSKLIPTLIPEPAIGPESLTPAKVPSTVHFSSVSIGSENAFAIDVLGRLWGWGNDKNGQTGLGLDEDTHTHRPLKLSDDKYASVFAADKWSTVVGNGVYTWGLNSKANQLQSAQPKLTAPTKIIDGSFTKVSGSDSTAAAIKSNGSTVTWGVNTFGITGQNATKDSSTIAPIKGNFKEIAFSAKGVVALDSDVGNLYSWGSDSAGISAADKQISTNTLEPLRQIVSKFTDIAAGRLSSNAVDVNGFVWAWGESSLPAISNAAQITSLPTQVPLGVKVTKIAASQTDVMVLTNKNELLFWGANAPAGQITAVKIPAGLVLDQVQSIVSGKSHFVLLDKKGAVYSVSTKSSLAQIPGQKIGELTGIKLTGAAQSIAAGKDASVAIIAGAAYGWGDNTAHKIKLTGTEGYIMSPVMLSKPYDGKWSVIAFSSTHLLAISDKGVLYGWGHSNYIDGLSGTEFTKPIHLSMDVKGNK